MKTVSLQHHFDVNVGLMHKNNGVLIGSAIPCNISPAATVCGTRHTALYLHPKHSSADTTWHRTPTSTPPLNTVFQKSASNSKATKRHLEYCIAPLTKVAFRSAYVCRDQCWESSFLKRTSSSSQVSKWTSSSSVQNVKLWTKSSFSQNRSVLFSLFFSACF